MIASTITRDGVTFPRPGKQFGLIDLAVTPPERPGVMKPGRLTQLKPDLAVIMSAEALFTLTDLAGLAPKDAIASVVHTTRTITEAAIRSRHQPRATCPPETPVRLRRLALALTQAVALECVVMTCRRDCGRIHICDDLRLRPDRQGQVADLHGVASQLADLEKQAEARG